MTAAKIAAVEPLHTAPVGAGGRAGGAALPPTNNPNPPPLTICCSFCIDFRPARDIRWGVPVCLDCR